MKSKIPLETIVNYIDQHKTVDRLPMLWTFRNILVVMTAALAFWMGGWWILPLALVIYLQFTAGAAYMLNAIRLYSNPDNPNIKEEDKITFYGETALPSGGRMMSIMVYIVVAYFFVGYDYFYSCLILATGFMLHAPFIEFRRAILKGKFDDAEAS